jgi:hypothetical protein
MIEGRPIGEVLADAWKRYVDVNREALAAEFEALAKAIRRDERWWGEG